VTSVRRFLFRSFLICIVIFSIFVGFAYRALTKATGRVYYPKERKKRNEQRRDRLVHQYGAQPVTFTTQDGVEIAGLLVTCPDARRNVLLCHGYRGNKEQLEWFLKLFPDSNALLFDFRGHGQSGGDMVTIGYLEEHDVSAAVQFLQTNPKTKDLPTVGLGISMGAASLVRAAAHGAKFEKLVLDSSFSNLWEHIGESFSWRTGLPRFPFLPILARMFCYLTGLSAHDHNPAELIALVNCPVLIVHSEQDTMVPVAHAHKLYEGAKENKQLFIAPCCRHGYACKDCLEQYSEKVADFLVEQFA